MLFKDKKVNKKVKYNGKKLKIKNAKGRHRCLKCYFRDKTINFCLNVPCSAVDRLDCKFIYYKEVNKNGK